MDSALNFDKVQQMEQFLLQRGTILPQEDRIQPVFKPAEQVGAKKGDLATDMGKVLKVPDEEEIVVPLKKPRIESQQVLDQEEKEEGELTQDEHVIVFNNEGGCTWDTDIDGGASTRKVVIDEEKEARRMLLQEGLSYELPSWTKNRDRLSCHLFVDGGFEGWSRRDAKVKVESHEWRIPQWVSAIRMRDVEVKASIVVLYLQKVKEVETKEVLYNQLAALCRAIKAASPHAKVFISNLLIVPGVVPVLGTATCQINRRVQEIAEGINKRMDKVFFLDMAVHFTQHQNFVPVRRFLTVGGLTAKGILKFRSCLLREIGIAPFHL